MSPVATRRPTARRRGSRVQLSAPVPSVVRCAIYTRKSTSEGLDSDFSSIDNQRESCEAYIRSQKSEGWTHNGESFDDGGFSGGNLERPALQRLVATIQAGQIDCVVVYKIDRMSRSLLDFVRLWELFDQHKVAFVSVTQQINTTTSTGRLMLNVLMSFAQFEREIISERTSDKMCAARRKGKWLGGPPILGYDIDREKHELVVNEDEAAMIREIFALYLERQSMMTVAQVLNERGWTTKSWTKKDGSRKEGLRWDKSKLHRVLTNVTYTGQTRHKNQVIPGKHHHILDTVTFDRVQALIASNGNGSGGRSRSKHPALLKGLLKCSDCGAGMAHTYTKKGKRLYRYYICDTRQKQGRDACETPALPAQQIEDFVVEQIRKLARDPDLIEQVFAETIKQQQALRPKLESERKRLSKERQQKGEAIRRLVSAIGTSKKPLASLTRSLEALEETVERIEQRLLVLDRDLATIDRQAIDKAHLTETLQQFDQLWDVMYPGERVEMVRGFVSRIEAESGVGGLLMAFSPQS